MPRIELHIEPLLAVAWQADGVHLGAQPLDALFILAPRKSVRRMESSGAGLERTMYSDRAASICNTRVEPQRNI